MIHKRTAVAVELGESNCKMKGHRVVNSNFTKF